MHIKRYYYYKIVDVIQFLYNHYPSFVSKIVGAYYDSQKDTSIHIENLNCIYIPVPKAGTKSIKKVLADYLYLEQSDERFNQAESQNKELPFKKASKSSLTELKKKNFIFAFVRNPYERILSCYFDKINKKTSYMGFLRYQKKFYRGMTFEHFVENISTIPDSEADQHFRSQYRFLINNEGLIPDYVGKVETMEADFHQISNHLQTDKLQLIHVNKSKAKKISAEEYFTPRVIQLIQERYKEDFQHFNYSIDFSTYL